MLFIPEAQAQSDTINNPVKDAWIEKMSDKIAVDLSVNNSYETFKVRAPSNPILLYPNTPNNLRLNVNYDFISLGIQFSPDFLPGNGDEEIKGETKAFQLSTALIFRHWFTDISYSKVQGYYLRNSSDFISWTDGDAFLQFPDLNYEGISISSGYIHNPRFSLRSLTSQTERQLKSAGSFIPQIHMEYYAIDDESGSESIQNSNHLKLNVGPGYAYTLVHKQRFYASLGLTAGIGYLNSRISSRTALQDTVTRQDNLLFRWDGKAGIGYNGSKFYAGFFTNVSGTRYKQENTTVINSETKVFYHIFFGMRFKAPEFLKKGVNKVKKLL